MAMPKKNLFEVKHEPHPDSGKLRVWWIPQVPGPAFRCEVRDVEQAIKLMDVLADYDRFQFENSIKPDYSNAGGLEVCDESGEWSEWYDENGSDIDEVRRSTSGN